MKKINLNGKRIEIMPSIDVKEPLGRYTVNLKDIYWYFETINDCYKFVQDNFCNYLLRVTDIFGTVDEENNLEKEQKSSLKELFSGIFGVK